MPWRFVNSNTAVQNRSNKLCDSFPETSLCVGEFFGQQSIKPKFLFEPDNIDAYAGTTIELTCQGEDDPPPEV